MTDAYVVEWVRSSSAWPALAGEWERLYALAPAPRSPYLSPGWAQAWLEVFGGRLRVATVHRGGQVCGIAPFLQVGRVLPTFVGIGQEVADYGGFVLGEEPEQVADALLDAVEGLLNRPGLVLLGRLAPGTVLHDRLVDRYASPGRLALSRLDTEIHPVLDLADLIARPEELARLKKRNDVPRRLRRLTERHTVDFEYSASGPEALEDFLSLHDKRWAGKDHRASGPFTSARGRRFLRSAARQLEAPGPLRISFVRIDGARVAGRFGFEVDGVYYGAKSAFDPALATSGPGHLLVGQLLDHAVSAGISRFDFMRGEGAHKSAWTERSIQVPYFRLHHGSALGRLEQLASRTRMSARYRMPETVTGPRLHTTTTAI